MYIGIQSFFDIPVHINVLTERFSFLTQNILFLQLNWNLFFEYLSTKTHCK